MVQVVTIGLVSLVVLGAAGIGRIVQSGDEENRYGVCQDFAARTLAKTAQRTVERAARDLAAASNGGSLYAAAKLGGESDPIVLALARTRLDQALTARQAAFAACAVQPAA